jgi:pilus assembly protein TadC
MITNITKVLEDKIPYSISKRIQTLLNYAGEEQKPEEWFILNSIFSLLFGFAFLAAPSIFFDYFKQFTETRFIFLSFILGLSAFIIYWIILYSSLFFKIEYRKRRTLEILPDFLSSVAMNIKAGMEPMSALYISLRPDFEPITSEMQKVRSLAIGSKSIIEQLSYLTTKIDSEPLRRTISIIDRASRSGGELGRLLLSVADDLRDTIRVQKELETSTKGYIYFISFLTIFGIPLLLSVSSVFIQTSSEQSKQFMGGFGGLMTGIPIQTTSVTSTIDPDSIFMIFLLMVSIGSISASLMLGVLWHAEVKQGLRYTIIILPLALLAFILFRSVMFSLIKSFGL